MPEPYIVPQGLLELPNAIKFMFRDNAFKTRDYMETITPIRTGFLRKHLAVFSFVMQESFIGAKVGWRRSTFGKTTFYAPFVSEGTGVYAGRSAIFPVKKKFLRYEYNNRWVTARSVKGQRPQQMLDKGIEFFKEKFMQKFVAYCGPLRITKVVL